MRWFARRTAAAIPSTVPSGTDDAIAQGIPGVVTATVLGLVDTGRIVHGAPVVGLLLELRDGTGQRIAVEAELAPVLVPRTGDVVTVVPCPETPGEFRYGGPAV